MFTVNDRLSIPDEELTFTFVRSSGPGGQNVNKVNSKAVLRWNVAANTSVAEDARERFAARQRRRITADGDIVISSDRYRDQARNIADCLDKLRAMLAEVATPPKRRRPTKPSKASRERRLKAKTEQSQKKQARRKKTWE